MFNILFKTLGFLGVFLSFSASSFAQPLDGFLAKKPYTLGVKVIRCEVDDGLPDDLPGVPPVQKHPACAHFQARILADAEIKILPGQKKVWQEVQKVPVSHQTYVGVFKDEGFVLERDTQPETMLLSGVRIEAYLKNVRKNQATLSLFVKDLGIENTGEEMLLHSDGNVFVNPHARQTTRFSTFLIKTPLKIKDVWGGQSVLKTPVIQDIPKVYPENARLWVEVFIKK